MGDASNEDLSKALSDLESRMNRSTRQLMRAQLSSMCQVSIVKELLSGERTLAELVQGVYGLTSTDEGYLTCYTRVRREVGDLESKGFVSRRMLGKNRPYRLTQLAVAKLTKMATVHSSWTSRLIPPADVILYTVTALLITLCALSSGGLVVLPLRSSFLVLFSVSLILGGMSLLRFMETVLRVI